MKLLRTYTIVLMMVSILFLGSCAAEAYVDTDESYKNELRPCIVNIHDEVSHTRGTGFIVNIDGMRFIMSAKHIFIERLEGLSIEKQLIAYFSNKTDILVYDINNNEYTVEIVSYTDSLDIMEDRGEDWIILTCPLEMWDLPFLTLSETLPWFGEEVYWAGFPDSGYGAIVSQTNIGDLIHDNTQIRLDTMIGPGASGSPLYDPEYGVVGIITMSTMPTHYGIALNIPYMYDDIMKELYKDLAVF